MDVIKEAFERIKLYMSSLKLEISLLKQQLADINSKNKIVSKAIIAIKIDLVFFIVVW